jgi:hypothetical protein
MLFDMQLCYISERLVSGFGTVGADQIAPLSTLKEWIFVIILHFLR